MIPGPLKDLIIRFEGLRLKSYQDTGGVWTIGYGSTGPGIGPGLEWTLEQAIGRMEMDSLSRLKAVRKSFPDLNENQLSAVVDFAYNVGLGKFMKSTLYKKLLSKDYAAAANEFERWVYDNGVKLEGLVKRRKAEKLIFLK